MDKSVQGLLLNILCVAKLLKIRHNFSCLCVSHQYTVNPYL